MDAVGQLRGDDARPGSRSIYTCYLSEEFRAEAYHQHVFDIFCPFCQTFVFTDWEIWLDIREE